MVSQISGTSGSEGFQVKQENSHIKSVSDKNENELNTGKKFNNDALKVDESMNKSGKTGSGIQTVISLYSEKPISKGFFGAAVDKANNLAGDIAYPDSPEITKLRISEFKESIANLSNEDKKTVARWVNGLMSFSDSTNRDILADLLKFNVEAIQPQKCPAVNISKMNEIKNLINELYEVKEIPENMDIDVKRQMNLHNKIKKLNNQESKEIAKLIPELMKDGNAYQRAHIRFIFDGTIDNIKTVKSVIKKAIDNTLNINQPVG